MLFTQVDNFIYVFLCKLVPSGSQGTFFKNQNIDKPVSLDLWATAYITGTCLAYYVPCTSDYRHSGDICLLGELCYEIILSTLHAIVSANVNHQLL